MPSLLYAGFVYFSSVWITYAASVICTTPQASERVKPLGTAVPLRDGPTEKPASQALIPRTASLRNTHKHLFPKESERNINNPHFPSGPPSHFP